MRPILAFSVFFILASAQFILLPTGHNAMLEDFSHNEKRCKDFILLPRVKDTVSFSANDIVEQVCQKNRPARSVPYGAIEVARFEHLQKEKEFQKEVDRFRQFLGTTYLYPDKFVAIFDINQEEFANKFNYPKDTFYDAWLAVSEKVIYCSRRNILAVRACGDYNSQKQWGALESVVPIGKFSSFGTIYKYRGIPEYAVEVGQNKYSVSGCLHLWSFARCRMLVNETCTLANYTNCPEVVKLTPKKVFWKGVAFEITVVAADISNYTTYINKTITTHRMDASKHVVLKLPIGSYAVFNNVEIGGQASEDFDHFVVHQDPDNISAVNGKDLDVLEKKFGNQSDIVMHRNALFPPSSSPSPFVSFPFDAVSRYLVWAIPIAAILFGTVVTILKRGNPKNVVRTSFHNVMYNAKDEEITFSNDGSNDEIV